jgi:hypothetical protein
LIQSLLDEYSNQFVAVMSDDSLITVRCQVPRSLKILCCVFFEFDASAYRKKFAFSSTYEEIEFVTEDLMKKLREHDIQCIKK